MHSTTDLHDRTATQGRSSRGVAMFMVLGVIVVVTMLGFLGMMLSQRDNASAGSAFGLKSQRTTAIAGLQLAVARMQAQPTTTMNALNGFIANNTNVWFAFPNSGAGTSSFSLQSTPTTFSLGTGGDESAVRVRILGVGVTGVDGGLPVYLSSTGIGRDGQAFEVRGVYKVRGLDYQSTFPTAGPTEGLLTLAGLENVDAGTTVDGGIYSGKADGITKLQARASGASFGRVRTAGHLEIYSTTAKPVTVAGNSVVGGYLKVDGGGVANFGGHLLVGQSGDASGGFGPIDGSLVVAKSLYVGGKTSPAPINKDITVGQDFWIKHMTFSFSGKLKVGTSGTTTSTVWLDSGLNSHENSELEINGRLDLGPRPGSTDHQIGGWVTVRGDLNNYRSGTVYSRFYIKGSTWIGGNFVTYSSISSHNTGPGGTQPTYAPWTTGTSFPCLTVVGQSWLGNGIKLIDRAGTVDSAGLVFRGATYLSRTNQETFDNGWARFEAPLVMNGSLDANFGTKKKWYFPKTIPAASRVWSFNTAGVSGKTGSIDSAVGTARTSDADFSAYPASIVPARTAPPTELALGYDAASLKLDIADNPASEVRLDKLGATRIANSEYEKLYEKYKAASPAGCGLPKDDPPTGKQLKCIYDAELKAGSGSVWNKQYLIIAITENTSRFNNLANITNDADRVLPTGTKIFWVINKSATMDVNGKWYAGQKGSVQILWASTKLNNFGWVGDFYGFIQMTGDYNYLYSPGATVGGAAPPFNLYGAIEVTKPPTVGVGGLRINAGAQFNIYRNDVATTQVFSDIAGNFFSSDGVGTGTDKWVIRFNGDRHLTDISKIPKLELKDGWIQLERVGEYR